MTLQARHILLRCLTAMAEFCLVSGVFTMVFGRTLEQNTASHIRFAMMVRIWLPIGSGCVRIIGLS